MVEYMVLKDDYNKDLFTVDKENLIYKSFLRRVKIKKSDIRSVFYGENILGVLTYSGNIYSFNIVKLLYSERDKLENLRNELSKENILFDYTNVSYNNYIFIIIFINPIINLISNDNKTGILIKLIIVMILFSLIVFLIKYYKETVIFNIDKDELEVKRGKRNFKYKRCEFDKIKLVGGNSKFTILQFEKNRKKYRLNFEDTPYLIKNYNVSLNKLFNIL